MKKKLIILIFIIQTLMAITVILAAISKVLANKMEEQN
jgi:hypothetical protein